MAGLLAAAAELRGPAGVEVASIDLAELLAAALASELLAARLLGPAGVEVEGIDLAELHALAVAWPRSPRSSLRRGRPRAAHVRSAGYGPVMGFLPRSLAWPTPSYKIRSDAGPPPAPRSPPDDSI